MSQEEPTLTQVLGALLFAARTPMSAADLRTVLLQAAQAGRDGAARFHQVQSAEIEAALAQLARALADPPPGLVLAEVAGGFRFQSHPAAGPWVRQLLNLDKPARLSKPALETLAIIAYRQPIARADIEAVRGVNVDAMMRHLLEVQLIRIVGRSDLPGRPLLYGTTQRFLEHFGLSSIRNLPGIEQLSRRDADHVRREQAARAAPAAADGAPGSEAPEATAGPALSEPSGPSEAPEPSAAPPPDPDPAAGPGPGGGGEHPSDTGEAGPRAAAGEAARAGTPA